MLGGGSNVVLADEIADLTVVRLANTEIPVDGDIVRAEAGAVWDDVVVAALAHGLGGLECLSGIPGSAGATPVQNVGAYGAEVADTIRRVRLLDRRTGEDRWVAPDELGFGYRTSILKHSEAAIVLEVEFALDAAGAVRRCATANWPTRWAPSRARAPTRRRCATRCWRCARGKGMVLDDADHDTWSVGSFFTNPVVTAAEFDRIQARVGGARAQLPGARRREAGRGLAGRARRLRQGLSRATARPARLSTKHALAVTNRGAATTADVIALARAVRDGVRTAFGIELTPEPILIGCRPLGTLGSREPRRPAAAGDQAAGLDRARGRVLWLRARWPPAAGQGSKAAGEAAEAPAAPTVTYEPGERRHRCGADRARRASRSRTAGSSGSALTNPDGGVVAGALNRDRTAFTITEPLGYGVDLHLGRHGRSAGTARPSPSRARSPR